MNVLAVGAHFDDIELGCGGALAHHVEKGDDVAVYIATHSGYSNSHGKVIRSREIARKEGEAAAKVLGVELIAGDWETNHLVFSDPLVCSVLNIVEERKIDTLYTHWTADAHQDHRALGRASITAGKHVPRVLMYQSNFYDAGEPFHGTFYVDISRTIEIKKRAIAVHKSELERVAGQWQDVFLKRCAVDGYRIGVAYAEVFQIVKYLQAP